MNKKMTVTIDLLEEDGNNKGINFQLAGDEDLKMRDLQYLATAFNQMVMDIIGNYIKTNHPNYVERLLDGGTDLEFLKDLGANTSVYELVSKSGIRIVKKGMVFTGKGGDA